MSNNKNLPLIRRNMVLEEVLQLAAPDELEAITLLLLDKENSRDDNARQRLARSLTQGELYKEVREIAFEIRSLGSVSLASFFRGGDPVSYDEVVRDVASEWKVKYSETDKTPCIEEKVLEVLAEQLAEQAKRESQTANIRLQPYLFNGIFNVHPLIAVGGLTLGMLTARKKARPELGGLTMIVVHIAKIRVSVAAADHENFIDRLRACL